MPNDTAVWPIFLGTLLLAGGAVGALFWQNWYYEKRRRERNRETSSETWQKAREMKARGEFQRKVKRQLAVSLERDELELECGHHYPVADRPPGESYYCKQCLDAWVQAETMAGR